MLVTSRPLMQCHLPDERDMYVTPLSNTSALLELHLKLKSLWPFLKWKENAWWCMYRPLVSACLLTVHFHGEYDNVCHLECGTMETGREFLFVGSCCFLLQGRLHTASHLARQQSSTKSGFTYIEQMLAVGCVRRIFNPVRMVQ